MTSGKAIMMPSSLTYRGPDFGGLHGTQSGTRAEYFGLNDFFRILRRRWILIVTFTLVGMLATILVLANIRPVYSSSATVVVQLPETVVSTTDLTPNQETVIETKVQILQSRRLARSVATSLDLDDDPEFADGSQKRRAIMKWFRGLLIQPSSREPDPDLRTQEEARLHSEAVADRLLDKVEISRVGRSGTIKITASSYDPQKAALIANRMVETYIDGEMIERRKSRQNDIKELEDRIAQVRSQMRQVDGTAAAYRARNGILASSPEASGATQVAQSAGLLAQVEADQAFDTRRAQANSLTAVSSPLLAELRQQESLVARRLSELGAIYGGAHPDVVKARAELLALSPRIAQEAHRVQGEMSTQAAASQARSGAVDATIANMQSRALASGVQAVPLRALERQGDASNALYLSLVGALNAKIAASSTVVPDLSIISRASLPSVPSYPIPQRILAVALLAFLLLGVIAAFIIDTMDTTIRTAAQVKRLLGIPTLAMVPDMSRNSDYRPVQDMVEAKPRSRFAEAMRNLLIELEARHGSGSHVVVVTSPLDGEGKSTIATSLAAAATAVGRRAVVVDFDLRRPNIASEERKSVGVVSYLSGKAGLDDLPVIQNGGQYAVIAVGDIPLDPGSLIASPRLPEMVDALREHYDFVILNAPPILPVRDAKTLTEYADSTLLVLRWGYTNPEAARVAMETFERPIAGAVINMIDYPAHARRRYGDVIHHMTNLTEYYDADDLDRASWADRLRRKWRRSRRRLAETLHFN
jgi:succinoglycan biosynthesis transport protein ExoP